MTHDPLCPIEPNPLARECRTCDLIAKVRADERNKIFTHLDNLADNDHVDWCRDLYCGGCSEIEDEL